MTNKTQYFRVRLYDSDFNALMTPRLLLKDLSQNDEDQML